MVDGDRPLHSGGMGLVTAKLELSNPRDGTVDVNPESPNIATGICKPVA
jgi:hypothetical protein